MTEIVEDDLQDLSLGLESWQFHLEQAIFLELLSPCFSVVIYNCNYKAKPGKM